MEFGLVETRPVLCATGAANAESLGPRRVTNTGKAGGTRNGQVISSLLTKLEFL